MGLQLSESRSLRIPIVNIDPLVSGLGNKETIAKEIRQACCNYGFFYIVRHGIDETLQQRLEQMNRVTQDDQAERWDRSSVHAFQGTYGEYVLSKVFKVLPELRSSVF